MCPRLKHGKSDRFVGFWKVIKQITLYFSEQGVAVRRPWKTYREIFIAGGHGRRIRSSLGVFWDVVLVYARIYRVTRYVYVNLVNIFHSSMYLQHV